MAGEARDVVVPFERLPLGREAVMLGKVRVGEISPLDYLKEPLARRELLGLDYGPGFPLVVVPARDLFDFPAVALKRASDVRLTGPILCSAIEQGSPGDEAKDAVFAVEHRKRDALENLELGVARWIGNKGHSEISNRQSLVAGEFRQISQGVGL
ncbi:hypothetical protein [Bradyrhizobium liaoningense]